MSSELVSVIVPTYNRAYCLRKTLDSVLAQTHPDWEVLLVDDGSTDSTRELVSREYGGEPRIRYIYQENAGVAHARNTGIAHVRGDYAAFLDSDDVWSPWKLAVQLACLRHFPEAGMVWTNMEAVNPEGQVIDRRHLETMYSAYKFFEKDTLFQKSIPLREITDQVQDKDARVYIGDIYPSMIMGSLVHTSTVLLRRERLEKVKGFSEDLKISGEDYDFHLRTCRYGPVALIDTPSMQYYKGRADNLSRNGASTSANFLLTIQREIAYDADAKRFSPENIKRVLSEAHAWLADERFKQKDFAGARRHAWKSLRGRPLQPRLIALLALACTPQSAAQPMLRAFRSIKRALRPQGAAKRN